MKLLEFTCDGCDLVEHCEVPPSGNIDFMLDGWVAHHIVSHENGSPAYDVAADLAPAARTRCIVRLILRTGRGRTKQ